MKTTNITKVTNMLMSEQIKIAYCLFFFSINVIPSGMERGTLSNYLLVFRL